MLFDDAGAERRGSDRRRDTRCMIRETNRDPINFCEIDQRQQVRFLNAGGIAAVAAKNGNVPAAGRPDRLQNGSDLLP